MFFSLIFSLEFANFGSILQSNQSVIDFLENGVFYPGQTAITRHQSVEHTRSRNAQILISFLVIYYTIAAHPSIKTLFVSFR